MYIIFNEITTEYVTIFERSNTMEKWRSRFTVIIVLGLLLSIFVTHNQAQVQAVGTFASDPA